MNVVRYPPQLDEHEDSVLRLDDHLTDEEAQERLEWLDRMAVARHGRPYIRSALGVLGIVATVCGIGALLFGLH